MSSWTIFSLALVGISGMMLLAYAAVLTAVQVLEYLLGRPI